jgi:hypothetical protein
MLTALQIAEVLDRITTYTGHFIVLGIFGDNINVTNLTIRSAFLSKLYIFECQQKDDYNSAIVIS